MIFPWLEALLSFLLFLPAVLRAQSTVFIDVNAPIEDESQQGAAMGRRELLAPPRVIPGHASRAGVGLNRNLFAALEGRYDPALSFNQITRDSGLLPFDLGPTIGWKTVDQTMRFWGSLLLGSSYFAPPNRRSELRFAERLGYRIGAGIRLRALDFRLEYQEMLPSVEAGRQSPFRSAWAGVRGLDERTWIASASFDLEP